MIKVIIERNIADGLEPNYQDAIRSTLKAALDAPGYISSESLTDVNKPNHKFIIIRWSTLAAWEMWHGSEARKVAISAIAPLLKESEKFTVLESI